MGRGAVVIPVGPGTEVAFLRDSLESIHHYMPSAEVVAVNDMGNRDVEAASDDPRVTWLAVLGSARHRGRVRVLCTRSSTSGTRGRRRWTTSTS